MVLWLSYLNTREGMSSEQKLALSLIPLTIGIDSMNFLSESL